MTVRLVALISVVLLLSLGAFGLMMSHYQQEFMDQLSRTASEVGQATLRTLDWHEVRGNRALLASERIRLHQRMIDDTAEGTEKQRKIKMVVTGAATIEEVRHIITTSTEDNRFTIREQVIYPADVFPSTLPDHDRRFEQCLLAHAQIEPQPGSATPVIIDLEDVRAVPDPLHGLVMTIPKFTTTPAGDTELTAGATVEYFVGDDEAADADVFFARRDEVSFPVPLEAYQDLFKHARSRSLFLFLGVFLVGTVLSTGLAARFTRPIRKLDAGIRRLSEGDLDVRVDVKGKNEIGRLSRAFNEMAGKLRINRDRAQELVRREKLSALGRLAAGVAHDVRNPLHSIGLTLEHLDETARPSEKDRVAEFDRSLDVIRGEIRRLDRLVGNFLRFATSERQERAAVDLAELLRDTERLVVKEAERRKVHIELELDEAVPQISANVEAIRSSVLNLFLNSLEAMPGGGTLTVSLRKEAEEIVLDVADTGQGIPEEHREHVFDFGYTTRESGNGLGLAMVHHCIVEEHGGRVSLDSRRGEGTRVRLTLPLEPETPS